MIGRREFVRLGLFGALAPSAAWGAPAEAAPTGRRRAEAAWNAFLKVYWMEERKLFRKHTGKDGPLDFWLAAHAWDSAIDACRILRRPEGRKMVGEFYDAFNRQYPDWLKNEFNDDLLWWTIACTNAYAATRDTRYLKRAQEVFGHLAEHEVDGTLGGGIWWKNSEHKSKNACANFPAVITAANLYAFTRKAQYLKTARELYAWGREKLFDEKTGAVYDNVNLEGKVNHWDFSYNIGTFIGSALRLHRHGGDAALLDDALKAGRHLATALSPNGILKPCGQGDGGAFNGIGVRYLAELARTAKGAELKNYLERNAASAWANRRAADGIVGPDWSKAPADAFDVEGETANSAVTLFFATV